MFCFLIYEYRIFFTLNMYNTMLKFLDHFSIFSLSSLFRGSLVDMAEAALPLQPAGQRATVRKPGDVPHHPDGAG